MKQHEMMTYNAVFKMAAPCALITSCTDFNPLAIVKGILNVSELPDGYRVVESVVSYDWHIDTKYYTADVYLCTTTERTIGNEKFAESVEAFVVYFDSHDESSFKKVSSWLPYLEHMNPQVQILVCKTCQDHDVVSRQTVLEWCIDNGFELVELEPAESNTDDDDDGFKEANGIERIVQALHAHTWPNLVIKNSSGISPFLRSLVEDERDDVTSTSETPEATTVIEPAGTQTETTVEGAAEEKSEICAGSSEDTKQKNHTDGKSVFSTASNSFESCMPSDQELAELFAALGNDEEPGGESFEQMFMRLQLMKEKAATLPQEERKVYAEQIAVAFWRAVGGDEDEIEGLF